MRSTTAAGVHRHRRRDFAEAAVCPFGILDALKATDVARSVAKTAYHTFRGRAGSPRWSAAPHPHRGRGLELRIRKLRDISFFPSPLERGRPVGQALFASVLEAYLPGCPSGHDLVEALDADTGIPESEIGALCDRPLSGQQFTYEFPDAIPPAGLAASAGPRRPPVP